MAENSATNTVKWGPIKLQPGVSPGNMSAFILAAVFTMAFSTFVPQAQPYILKEILGIPASELGSLTGLLGFASTIVGLVMPGIWGTLSDRTGRKIVYAIGYMLSAVGLVLCPLATSILVIFLVRMLFAAGSNASHTMSSTLLADYVNPADRGKAIGMSAMGGGIGALLTVFVFLRLPSTFQGSGASPFQAGLYTYLIVASLGILAAVMVLLGLLGKKRNLAENRRGFLTIAKEALAAAKAHPGIRLAFGVNFAASGTITAVGSFFTLWLVSYGTAEAGLSSAQALARAGMVMGISQMMGLVAAPFFGILSDKLGRVKAVILATGLSALATAPPSSSRIPWAGP